MLHLLKAIVKYWNEFFSKISQKCILSKLILIDTLITTGYLNA